MTIRADLNTASPNQLADELRTIKFGDLVGFITQKIVAGTGLGYTEADVVPAANIATLSAAPTVILPVNAGTATVTGVKTLKRGPITGPSAIVPATTECVWDGNTSVLFATADAVTKVSFLYITGTTAVCSLTSGTLQGA